MNFVKILGVAGFPQVGFVTPSDQHMVLTYSCSRRGWVYERQPGPVVWKTKHPNRSCCLTGKGQYHRLSFVSWVSMFGKKISCVGAKWAPTSCKWGYIILSKYPYKWPYKWETWVITLLTGVTTLFITGRRGRSCVIKLQWLHHQVFYFLIQGCVMPSGLLPEPERFIGFLSDFFLCYSWI